MIKFDDYREKYSHIRMETAGRDSADNLSYRGLRHSNGVGRRTSSLATLSLISHATRRIGLS